MKSKKLLVVLTALFCCFASAFVFTSCNKGGDDACAHVLEKHESVAATCTDDGTKTYWECTKCGKYFADAKATTEITQEQTVEKATGVHTFDGGYVCTSCGEPLLAENFKENVSASVNEAFENGFAVTVDFTDTVTSENSSRTTEIRNGEIVFDFASENEVPVALSFNVVMTDVYEGEESVFSVSVKAVLQGDTVYAEAIGAEDNEGEYAYVVVPASVVEDLVQRLIDQYLGGIPGVGEMIPDEELPITPAYVSGDLKIAYAATEGIEAVFSELEVVFRALFRPEATTDGYTFNFDWSIFSALNEQLSQMTVKDLFNAIVSAASEEPVEDAYAQVTTIAVTTYVSVIENVLPMTVGQVLDAIEEQFGMTVSDVLDQAGAMLAEYTGGAITSVEQLIYIASQGKIKIDISEYLADEQLLGMKIEDLLKKVFGVEELDLPMSAQIEMMMNQIGAMRVYDLLAQVIVEMTGDNTLTATGIKTMIDAVIGELTENVKISAKTDKEGNLLTIETEVRQNGESEEQTCKVAVYFSGYTAKADYDNVAGNASAKVTKMTADNVDSEEGVVAVDELGNVTITITSSNTSEDGTVNETYVTTYTFNLANVIYGYDHADAAEEGKLMAVVVATENYVKKIGEETTYTSASSLYLLTFEFTEGKFVR